MQPPAPPTAPYAGTMHAELAERLLTLQPATQPGVAVRILELVQNPDSAVGDYAKIVRADATLTGRLLRLANSSYFAQRTPVSTLERAMVLLGLERIKAVSLGFYLSRTAAGGGALSRRVWGESVYRACLAAALAKACPRADVSGRGAEAFIVGLMLDCGVPLMPALVGERYAEVADADPPLAPTPACELERERFGFTHADVAAVLAQRWRFPELLSVPIAGHHTAPGEAPDSAEAKASRLLPISRCVGALALTRGSSLPEPMPRPEAAPDLSAGPLGLDPSAIALAAAGAAAEYDAVMLLFRDVADPIAGLEALAEAVHRQVVEALDEQLARSMRHAAPGAAPAPAPAAPAPGGPALRRLRVAGQNVELERRPEGGVVAYIRSETGQRLITCAIDPAHGTAPLLRRDLGLEEADDEEIGALLRTARSMAA